MDVMVFPSFYLQLKDLNEIDHDVQNKKEEKFADAMNEIAAVKEEVDGVDKKITVVDQQIADTEQQIVAVSITYEETCTNIEKKMVDIEREPNDQIKQSYIVDLDRLTKREARLGDREKRLGDKEKQLRKEKEQLRNKEEWLTKLRGEQLQQKSKTFKIYLLYVTPNKCHFSSKVCIERGLVYTKFVTPPVDFLGTFDYLYNLSKGQGKDEREKDEQGKDKQCWIEVADEIGMSW